MNANVILFLLFCLELPPTRSFPSPSTLTHGRGTSDDVDSDIIIIGGGLVGMATGVALSERGVSSCQIYERAKQLRKVGAAIGLYPNGLTALGYISPSILDTVKSTSSPCQVFERRDLNNEIVQVTEVPTIKATAPVMYAWYKLQQHFADALTEENSSIHLGHEFQSYEVRENGVVEVKLLRDDNVITKTCRILIGADGIHSKVRQQLVGSPTQITYYGKVMYRAVLQKELVDNILIVPEGSQISWQGDEKGKSFSLRETTQGVITITAAALAECHYHQDNGNNGTTKKQRLQNLFSEFPSTVQQLINKLSDSTIHEDYIRDVNIPKEWSQGEQVVLLGDAVHAMTPHMGQGANQGLEDVCELVERITTTTAAGGRRRSPLTSFVEARLPRVTEIQERSRQNTVQSNTFDKGTASIPFERRKYSESFQDRLYNWKPPSCISKYVVSD